METEQSFIYSTENVSAYKREETDPDLYALECAYVTGSSQLSKTDYIVLRDSFLVAGICLLTDGYGSTLDDGKGFFAINCHRDSHFYYNIGIIKKNMNCLVYYKSENSKMFHLVMNSKKQPNTDNGSILLFDTLSTIKHNSYIESFSQLHPRAMCGINSLLYKHCPDLLKEIRLDISIPHLYFR